MNKIVWTIGHSNHSAQHFLSLLQANGITAVADVRSQPFSRFCPHFNQRALKAGLKQNQIAYTFLGKELGARSEDDSCYDPEGKVIYRRLAETAEFKEGLRRVDEGVEKGYHIALMCSEREPLECHRTFLISKELILRGYMVMHIHADFSTEEHSATMKRLLYLLKVQDDLFNSELERIEEACRLQESKISYKRSSKIPGELINSR